MSSNCGEKVLNSIEIGWTQDLRVQHKYWGSEVHWLRRTQLNELETDTRTEIEKLPGGLPFLGPAKIMNFKYFYKALTIEPNIIIIKFNSK